MSPVQHLVMKGGVLRPFGGPAGPAVGSRAWRETLVPGTFVPDQRTNGLTLGTDISSMTQVTSSTGSAIPLGTSLVQDTIFWSKVSCARNGADGSGSRVQNVAVAGPRPDLVTPGDVLYLVKANDSDTSPHSLDDLWVNPFLWMREDAPGGPFTETQIREAYFNSIGYKGAFGHLRNALIENCQDDVQWGAPMASPDDDRQSTLESCWLQRPIRYKGPLHPAQPEGTHSDNLQPQVGRNFRQLGGMNGGPTDPDALDSWGCLVTWVQENYAANPALMKQGNIHYDRVIFWSATGGNYCMNIGYKTDYPNLFDDDCSLEGCLFVYRADGKYVIRNATRHGHLDSPTNRIISTPTDGVWTDLGPVTYKNG